MTESAGAATHHWREYPVGLVGEAARMFLRTLAPFGVMLIITFALMLVIGLAMEEGLADDLLAALGYDTATQDQVVTMLDQLFRVAMIVVVIVGLLVGFGVCTALCVRDITASTAVAAAAEAGAPATAVPTPRQVESIIKRQFLPLRMLLLICAGTAVFAGVVMLIVALASDFPEMIVPAIVLSAIGVLLVLPFLLLQRILEPRHRARHRLIADHWAESDEQAAWDAAAAHAEEPAPVGHGMSRNRLVDKGQRLADLGARAVGVALLVGIALVMVTHPYSSRLHDAGPRVTYPAAIETGITIGYWVLLIVVVAAVACGVVGQVLEGSGRAAERAALREQLAMPHPPRLPIQIAQDYGQRRSVRLAQGVAMIAGIAAVLGPSVWWLSTMASGETYDDAVTLFAPFRTPALIITAAGLVLFAIACVWNAVANARSAEVRNQVLRQWPTEPAEEDQKDSDGKPIPARVGPALHRDPTAAPDA